MTQTIGDRARVRRKELGLTPTQVARRVQKAGRESIRIQHIQKLENNKVRSITYLAELSIALECDPVWLSTGQQPSQISPEIDIDRLTLAWDAAETVIDEHSLPVALKDKIALALDVYRDLNGGDAAPAEVAQAALFRLLVERQKRSTS